MKKISIIIVNYNSSKYLDQIFEMLNLQTFVDFEVVLIDNKSTMDDAKYIHESFVVSGKYDWLKFYESDKNGGFAYGVNFGVNRSGGEYLLIMNPDTEIRNVDFLNQVINIFKSEEELCSGKLIAGFSDDDEYNNSFTIDKYGYPCEGETKKRNAYVYGCLMMVSRYNYIHTAGMDSNFFMYFEETDWCIRSLLLGYSVKMLTVPQGLYYHEGGGSTGKGENVPYIIQRSFYINHLAMVYKNYSYRYLIYLYPVLVLFYLIDLAFALMSMRIIKARAIAASIFNIPQIIATHKNARIDNFAKFKINIEYLIDNYFAKSNPISRKLINGKF